MLLCDDQPDLQTFDAIVVNSSAGKDSQAMLDYVHEKAREQLARSVLVVLHCDLGVSPKGEPIEWPGTLELAREQAEHYGVRFEVVKRTVRGFLEEILARGKWPSNSQRYCTSYYKRDQGGKLLTRLANEARSARKPRPRILNCFGFRAQESPRRKKLPVLALNKNFCTGNKEVWDWLPIHGWSEDQVWERIRRAGTRSHPAYAQGMTRLSCRFCIYAPLGQLMLSARLNPRLFEEYLEVEKSIGHAFRKELPLAEVKRALDAGERPPCDDGAWNM